MHFSSLYKDLLIVQTVTDHVSTLVSSLIMREELWFEMPCVWYRCVRVSPAAVEVQAARGFMLSGILLCGFAILVASVGMKCTKCLEENMELKNKVAVAGGAVFILAGEEICYPIPENITSGTEKSLQMENIVPVITNSHRLNCAMCKNKRW